MNLPAIQLDGLLIVGKPGTGRSPATDALIRAAGSARSHFRTASPYSATVCSQQDSLRNSMPHKEAGSARSHFRTASPYSATVCSQQDFLRNFLCAEEAASGFANLHEITGLPSVGEHSNDNSITTKELCHEELS